MIVFYSAEGGVLTAKLRFSAGAFYGLAADVISMFTTHWH
jgi:hypothetical protein